MVGQMIESWTILRFPPPNKGKGSHEVRQPPFQSGGLDHSNKDRWDFYFAFVGDKREKGRS